MPDRKIAFICRQSSIFVQRVGRALFQFLDQNEAQATVFASEAFPDYQDSGVGKGLQSSYEVIVDLCRNKNKVFTVRAGDGYRGNV